MMRVRFAPSPTGNLHIGGGRTALFNWLYAKASRGAFVLRIEDTDAARSRKEYLDEILQSLAWLGFNWDEIYYQSQRFDIYREHAQKLVSEGLAYIEKSEEGKEAIIFRVSPQKIKVRDLIRGDIEFDATTIKDQVLIKSDGTPTYNFACVVDDATMHITHVVRGDDHISNTPKQILLYKALGFNIPGFAHLPLILAKEGGRLSKRKGATAISEYRAMGYLPEALVNYLLLLGWSPGDNREIIDICEAISLFDIKAVNKTAAVLDLDKLDWMNNQYLKRTDAEKLADQLMPLLVEKKYIAQENYDRQYVVSLVQLFKDRLCVLNDFVDWADFFFLDNIAVDEEARGKFLSTDLSKEFRLFIEKLEKLEIFDIIHIEETFRELVQQLNIQSRALIHPIRVALTGKTVGPGLFEVIYYLGKERTKKRLMRWVTKEEAE
ncbi:MAG: glutamate--tRNA ligase [Candidatus Omnitrophota bacterium]|nr:MAG: glutamate--tRNA ligase [Candidatus Omnitrophota bacterium]